MWFAEKKTTSQHDDGNAQLYINFVIKKKHNEIGTTFHRLG